MYQASTSRVRRSPVLKRVKRLFRPVYARFVHALPADWHVILDYVRAHGRVPNLQHPRTFNEKIARRKVRERDARFPDLIDKIKVKEIVGSRYGHEFINPTLAVYNSSTEMDFTQPPLRVPPYVIKASHGSGMTLLVRDAPIDQTAIREQVDAWLKVDHSTAAEEWAYSQIKPRILVEALMGGSRTITDYKFHVFSGSVYAIEVVLDRFAEYRINFYSPSWDLLDIKRYAGRLPSELPVQPPKRLGTMLELAESIGRDFSYVRVDLYAIEEEIKFGELTFYTGAANDRFEPVEWDMKFGEQWISEEPRQRCAAEQIVDSLREGVVDLGRR